MLPRSLQNGTLYSLFYLFLPLELISINSIVARAKTAPKFTSPVHGVMTEEGVAVKLVGVFQGSPDFRVNWLHNSKVLVSNDEVGIETKNKVTSLVIKKVGL